MIPHTTCQKCGEFLDATNHDAYGERHPSDEACSFWDRLEAWENERAKLSMRLPKGTVVTSALRTARDFDYHQDTGEAGA